MQFLLVAVAGLKKRFITLSDGFKLVAKRLQLVIILDISAFGARNVVI